jgi:superfamily II DNA or RNA helicase
MSEIVLRWYQEEAKKRILNNIDNKVKKQLIELSTGSGKTILAGSAIQELIARGLKVFFIVGNAPLVMQTYKSFKNLGLRPSILKSGSDKFFDEYADIQIIMAQTYKARINKIDELHADVIFIDECHYLHDSNTMNAILEKHPDSYIVSMSATPIDAKGYLLPGYDKYEMNIVNIRQLQKEGLLAIDRYFPATPMDISGVRIKNTGEFNDKDLDEKCNQSYITEDIVQGYLKFNEGHKAICYAININHGEKLRDAFLDAGIKTGLIHSKMKKFQIQYWMDAHRSGRIQLLINVSCLVQGYDDISLVDMIDAQPVNTLRKQIQKWGRVCRMDDLGIGYARIFDFGGNYDRFLAWSMPRIYSLDKAFEVKPEFKSIVCPSCFEPIYERVNKCPNCGFILTAQMEKKEREIKDNLRVQEIKEIKALTGSSGAIEALDNLLGDRGNGNTFYYSLLLSKKPASVETETFNSEVIRLANYARRKGYNPYYVVQRIKEKINT